MRATSDYNLGKLNAELARQWHPTKNEKLMPSDVTPRSEKKVWWMCSRGHEWYARVADRTSGTGCPKCYAERRGKRFRRVALRKSENKKEKSIQATLTEYPD